MSEEAAGQLKQSVTSACLFVYSRSLAGRLEESVGLELEESVEKGVIHIETGRRSAHLLQHAIRDIQELNRSEARSCFGILFFSYLQRGLASRR